MAEVDTSSYLKPAALPTQKGILDQVQDYQKIESNSIGLDQSKLKLMNDQFNLINSELSTLIANPSATKEDAAKKLTTFAQTYKLPPQVVQHMLGELQSAPDVKSFAENALTRGQTVQERINLQYGVPGIIQDNANIQPVVSSPKFGVRATNQPIPIQIPPTTQVVDPANPTGPTRLQGPQPSAPLVPPRTGLPIQGSAPAPVMAPASGGRETLPVAQKPPGIEPRDFNLRFNGAPTGPAVAQGPGIAEAEKEAGAASGSQLAEARKKAASFQRDIFPLTEAIPALEKLGTKGTGPGTETIQALKSFVLSNVPGVKESSFDGTVKDYDKAKKYLTDFVNQTGSTGTNDKLAAAFAGNPSVGISNAAAVDVAKSALALRYMQQAQYLEFEKLGKPSSEFSKWVAQRTNELDPRAFGVNMMKPEAKKKLLEQLNKNPREKERFEKSAQLAVDFGFVAPR